MPWVVDGITEFESDAMVNLCNVAWIGQSAHNYRTGETWEVPPDLALARQWMLQLGQQPSVSDLILLQRLLTLRVLAYEDFNRLIAAPWYVDGLSESETIYLLAAIGGDVTGGILAPYSMATSTVVLPLSGETDLWVVWHESEPATSILAMLEKAVMGVEDFVTMPFPFKDIVLYLSPGSGYRGAHYRTGMSLHYNVSQRTVSHETAHYFFQEGSTWFSEGAAEYVAEWIDGEGVHPGVEFPQWCVDDGIENLYSLLVYPNPSFDFCRYVMGEHFLVVLSDLIGEERLREALRETVLAFIEFRDANMALNNWGPDRTGDDIFYGIVLKHTPEDIEADVITAFHKFHGGPFVEDE